MKISKKKYQSSTLLVSFSLYSHWPPFASAALFVLLNLLNSGRQHARDNLKIQNVNFKQTAINANASMTTTIQPIVSKNPNLFDISLFTRSYWSIIFE